MVQTVSVQALEGAFCVLSGRHRDEGEPLAYARLFGRSRNEDSLNATKRLEQDLQIAVRDPVAEIRNAERAVVFTCDRGCARSARRRLVLAVSRGLRGGRRGLLGSAPEPLPDGATAGLLGGRAEDGVYGLLPEDLVVVPDRHALLCALERDLFIGSLGAAGSATLVNRLAESIHNMSLDHVVWAGYGREKTNKQRKGCTII